MQKYLLKMSPQTPPDYKRLEPCLVAVDDEIERGVERGEEVREGDHGVRPRRRPHRRHVLTCGNGSVINTCGVHQNTTRALLGWLSY